ncbi:G5 domain-containing protein [Streptococcus merionis]|uniref:G5 domain-containing protein n=1 Tax=Streptococcus merionis TaxID=400065 RepID=UPI0035188F04
MPKEVELSKEPETVTLTQKPEEPLPVAEARAGDSGRSGKEVRDESQKLFLQYLYQKVQELRDVDYEQYGTTKNLDSSKNLDNVFASSDKDGTDLAVAMAGYVDSIVKARGQESEGKKNFSDYIQKDYAEASLKGLKELEEKIRGNSSASEELKKTYIHRLGRVTSLVEFYKTIPAEFEQEVEKLKKEAELQKDQPQGDAPAKPDQEQPQSDVPASPEKEDQSQSEKPAEPKKDQLKKDDSAKPEEKQLEKQDDTSADSEKEEPQKDAPADQNKIAEYREMYKKIKELADAGYGNYSSNIGDVPGQDLTEAFSKNDSPVDELAGKLIAFASYGIVNESNGSPKMFNTPEEFEPYLKQHYEEALKQQKEAQKKMITDSSASERLKKRYNELLDNETNLTKAHKEIPEQFNKELAQEQRAELQEAIDEAEKQIYTISYLKERNSYIQRLKNVSSKEEIANIIKEATEAAKKDKADFEATKKVTEEINKLKYLTQDQKIGYSTELEDKTKEQADKILERAKDENLQGLIQAGLGLIKELQPELTRVEKLPEAPRTEDYNEQHNLWKYFSELGKAQVNNFKGYSVKPDLKDFGKIEKTYKDLVDFGYQLKIEDYTRQVAEYRKKYSGHQKIEELFKKGLKQASDNNYASLFGNNLRVYFETELTPAFQKIQQLVNNLDKKAEGAQKLEKLIAEYSKKPKTSELMRALEEREALIKVANEEVGGFDTLIAKYVKEAEDAVVTYNKEYQMYQQVLQKGQDDIRAQIARLRALNGKEATELADKIEKQEISYLATAELSGAVGYKTFIPNNVARIKQEVDDFIAEYEKNHRPLIPLEPAIVESKEVEKQEIAYETKEVPNPNLPKGKSQVKIKGQKGEKTITYKVKKQGDKVISREQISEEVTKAPVTEVVEVGTKEVKPSQPKPHTLEIKTHQEKKEVEIPFETKQVENKDLPKGQTRVKQEGKVGIRTIVEEITTKDGKVVSRKTIIDEVTTKPILRIIEVGTKEETPVPTPPAIVESEETETQDIAYETKEVLNPNLPKGERKVTTPGQKGQKTITYKVKKQGDKVISREKISEQVTKAPVTEVVEVGTKEVKPTPPTPHTPEIKTHQEKKEVEIPFETKQVENKDLPKGQTRVKQEGKVGIRTIVEEITTKDGKVVSRKIIVDEVTTKPLTRIVEIGTKEVKPALTPSKPETKTQQGKKEMGTKEPEKMAPEMDQKSQKQVPAGTQKGSSDKTPKKQLPNTGEATSIFAALGSVLLILVMALAIQKKKKSEK